jgi:miniconductance mechanosensitive channel
MGIQPKNYLTDWLTGLGLEGAVVIYLRIAILLCLLIVVCYIVNLLVRKILIYYLNIIIKKSKNVWDDALVENKVFTSLSHIAPAIVLYVSAPLSFRD